MSSTKLECRNSSDVTHGHRMNACTKGASPSIDGNKSVL